jgi:hypothetical protein
VEKRGWGVSWITGLAPFLPRSVHVLLSLRFVGDSNLLASIFGSCLSNLSHRTRQHFLLAHVARGFLEFQYMLDM